MVMPGNNGDLAVTLTTTKSPSGRSCTTAPSGAVRCAALDAEPPSPRAARRAASRAASIQRTCIDTAVSPDTQRMSTTTRAAIANAASTVTPPAEPAIQLPPAEPAIQLPPAEPAIQPPPAEPAIQPPPASSPRRLCSTPG